MSLEEFKKRWQRDKYLLLERSPETYARISDILKGVTGETIDTDPGGGEPDRLLDEGLVSPPSPRSRREAALLVWSRLEDKAGDRLAVQARELLGRLEEDPWAIVYLKRVFKILAAQQGWKSFLESSYLDLED